jgi:hypothetical protein
LTDWRATVNGALSAAKRLAERKGLKVKSINGLFLTKASYEERDIEVTVSAPLEATMDIRDIYEAHNEAYRQGFLPMYNVYNSPQDHPGKFVMRMFLIGRGNVDPTITDIMVVVDTLEQARKAVPPGLVRMVPQERADHPSVVESWF